MAGGGLIQLVSIGAQDVYLVGNPQITFFKVTYQRHTNFARECIEQQVLGTPGFNNKVSVIISRSGDLVGPMHAEFGLPALPSNVTGAGIANVYSSGVVTGTSVAGAYNGSHTFNWCWVNYIGFRLLKEVTIEIGGQPIDRHYSIWFYMWFELSTPASKREGLQRMVGGYDITEVPLGLTTNAVNPKTVYVPLVFWFNTHPGLALPLIALQYHEVRISISIESLDNCVVLLEAASQSGAAFSNVLDLHWRTWAGPSDFTIPDLKLQVWADYYYLDSEERKRFAQGSHEYLIKQVQALENPNVQPSGPGSIDYKTFNHPVSFHVWGFRRNSAGAAADWTNFTNSPPFLQFLGNSIVDEHRLTLNGNDRYTNKKVDYYNLVQPYNHFTAIPPVGVLTYSYAIQPVEHQPSGSLNFSRIDNAANRFTTISPEGTLNGLLGVSRDTIWNGDSYTGIVFGVNYNVLRIMSGMGGLAYSN